MFATISLIVIAQILQPQHSSKNKDRRRKTVQ